MTANSPFFEAPNYAPAATSEHAGVTRPLLFGDLADEYDAVCSGAALFDRSDRGVLSVSGSDAKQWLHGLLTNAIAPLTPGLGCYAFAVNVKGRIVFDVNAFCLPDELWLDLDLAALASAAAHLDRYLIAEDVRVSDATGQFARLACSGPRAAQVAFELGVSNLTDMSALSHAPIPNGATRLIRHDIAGDTAFELVVPRGDAAKWWERLIGLGVTPAGHDTLDVRRIENGIPWLFRDIDDTTVPPETGQIERGVSYNKGCFIGHEVLERMRSRGALAKRLVALRIANAEDPPPPQPLLRDGVEIGHVTSLVRHPRGEHWLGLGYLKTNVTGYADITISPSGQPVTICSQ